MDLQKFADLERAHGTVAAPKKPRYRILWEYEVDTLGVIRMVPACYRCLRLATVWFFDHPEYGFYGIKANGERT